MLFFVGGALKVGAQRHIIALLRSHIDGDNEQFLAVALQMAAQEARQGHTRLAEDLRELVDSARVRKSDLEARRPAAVPLAQPKGELANLVAVRYSDSPLEHGAARRA